MRPHTPVNSPEESPAHAVLLADTVHQMAGVRKDDMVPALGIPIYAEQRHWGVAHRLADVLLYPDQAFIQRERVQGRVTKDIVVTSREEYLPRVIVLAI